MKTSSISQMTIAPELTPDSAQEYFLEFSTRGEYFAKRNQWKELYSQLSWVIRSNKNRSKSMRSWRDKIQYRIAKSGREYIPAEFNERYAMATRSIPPQISDLGFDATELLEIRADMKAQAGYQMAERNYEEDMVLNV
jgi:hypothetical protein